MFSGVKKVIGVALLSVAISGCAVKSNVSRFNNLPPQTDGKSFFIFTLDEQKGSAEFLHYASSISARLRGLGYSEAQSISNADYIAVFNYGIGGAREISGAMPIYGPTGGGTTYQSGTASAYGPGGSAFGSYSGTSYTAPTYGVTGYSSFSRTEYGRYFVFRMIDAKKSSKDNLVPVYEATVTSSGSSSNFGEVSECLFDAVFENFYETGSDRVTGLTANCGNNQ